MSFSNLPEEIIFNILSRIPIKAVFTCKCVCKSWLNLLETPEFTRSHHYESAPGLLVNGCNGVFKIFDIEQGDEQLHHKRLIELDPKEILRDNTTWSSRIEGSTNGLILFRKGSPEQYYICNPITREWVKLPTPQHKGPFLRIATHGFGVSRSSGQYKVVRMLKGHTRDRKFTFQVYAPGSWRSIAITPPGHEELFEYRVHRKGTFLNGNLHWLVKDLREDFWWVSCFDLETEDFTKSRAPPAAAFEWSYYEIGVLRDCLCLCDNSSSQSEFVIYVYEKKSSCWNKECVISKTSSPDLLRIWPIKVFGDGDGDVLLALELAEQGSTRMFCYSSRTNKRTDTICVYSSYDGYFETLLYTPSFVSLGDFETGVIRF